MNRSGHPATLRRLAASDTVVPKVLALLQTEFAYMDATIDPPSSLHRLSLADVAAQMETGEVWVIGDVAACVFLTPKPDVLYVGKLAVAAPSRGQGHARTLITLASQRARVRGLPMLELQVRIELIGNQAAFQAMGFIEVARTAHPGYDRPTSITYRRPVPKDRP